MKLTCRVLGVVLLFLAGLLGPAASAGAAVPTISGGVTSIKGPVDKGKVYFYATCADHANQAATSVGTIKSGAYSALVPPGTYRVFIDPSSPTAVESWHAGAAACEHATVVTVTGDLSIDLVAAPRFTLTGTVRSSDGPIPNATITVYRGCEQFEADEPQHVMIGSSDANGVYSLGLPAGTYRVRIQAKSTFGNLGSAPSWHNAQLRCADATDVVVGQDATLDLVALPTATVTGTVSSVNATVTQGQVRFYLSCADFAWDQKRSVPYRSAAAVLMDNGSYTLQVAAGTYRVYVNPFGPETVMASWHSGAATCEQATEVVVAGNATVPLTLRGTGNVTGTVRAGKIPVAQGGLTFYADCQAARQGPASATIWFTGGTFTATIPDGSYVIKISNTVTRDSWHNAVDNCEAATPVVVNGRTTLDLVGLTSAQSVTRPPKKVKLGKRATLARQTDRGSRVRWTSLTKKTCTVRKYKLKGLRKGKCRVSVQTTDVVLGLDAVSRKFTIRIA